MDEDEDAFLYGDGDQDANTGNGVSDAAAAAVTNAKQPVPIDQDGQKDQKNDDENENEEESEEEEEEEEEDSDSDLEIIVDSNAVDVKPPPGYNARPLAPYNKSYQAQKTAGNAAAAAISTEYTPLTRPGQSSAAMESVSGMSTTTGAAPTLETKPLTGQIELTPAQAQALQQQQDSQSQLPEGPPPPAPITAPRIDLDPSGQALMLPPEVAGGEAGPLIYHLDPTEMEEKPWRRPGADLSDWFNYGLNEESWRAWGEKKTSIRQERLEMEKEGYSNRAKGTESNELHYQDGGMMQQQQQQQLQQQHQQMQQYGVPPQQLQMMQAMMAASGMNMPVDQMMAFMGMQPGAGGFGMGQSNPMMNMMGMNNPMGMMGFPYGGGNMSMMQKNQDLQQNQAYGGSNENYDYQDENANEEAEYEPTDDVRPPSNDFTTSAAEATVSANGTENSGANAPAQLLPNQPLPVGEIPTGPSADRGNENKDRSKSPLPHQIPTGPKNPGRRYNDRDTGAGVADSLDYGAGGGLREDGGERRHSAESRSPMHVRDTSAGWDNDIPTGPRSDRDRDNGRRRTSSRRDDEDDTPRSSRYDDDDHESDVKGEGRYKSHSSRSVRDKSRRDRRRGGAGAGGGEIEDEERREEDENSKSISSKSRSNARSDRRAGRDAPEEDSHSSSRRSRKRTTTDDGDLLSPPREPRRRRG